MKFIKNFDITYYDCDVSYPVIKKINEKQVKKLLNISDQEEIYITANNLPFEDDFTKDVNLQISDKFLICKFDTISSSYDYYYGVIHSKF